jgi:hypothetical protein
VVIAHLFVGLGNFVESQSHAFSGLPNEVNSVLFRVTSLDFMESALIKHF